jgi:hypothetical protein
MEQQLPLFVNYPHRQADHPEALTLLERQLREPGAHLPPAAQYVTGCACSLPHWSAKSLPRCGSITSTG